MNTFRRISLFFIIAVLSLTACLPQTTPAPVPSPTPAATLSVHIDDTITIDALKKEHHSILQGVHLLQIEPEQFETSGAVVIRFDNRSTRVTHAYDPVEFGKPFQRILFFDQLPKDLLNLFIYEDNQSYTLCFMPKIDQDLKIHTLYSKTTTLQRDYQYQHFDGYFIPLCGEKWLLVDNKGIGYVVNGLEINGKVVEDDQLWTPVSGYTFALNKTVRITSERQQNLDTEQKAINIVNQYYVDTSTDDSATNYDDACNTLGYTIQRRAYTPAPVSVDEYETLCGPMNFRQKWGISDVYLSLDRKYVYAIASYAPPSNIIRLDKNNNEAISLHFCHGDLITAGCGGKEMTIFFPSGYTSQSMLTDYLLILPLSAFIPDSCVGSGLRHGFCPPIPPSLTRTDHSIDLPVGSTVYSFK